MRQRHETDHLFDPSAVDALAAAAPGKATRTSALSGDDSLQLSAAAPRAASRRAGASLESWPGDDPGMMQAMGLAGGDAGSSWGPSTRVLQARTAMTSAAHAPAEASQDRGPDPDQDRGQVAADGVASATGGLPAHASLQVLFGHHDLSGLRVATGPAAQHAAQALGAEGYAFGDRVALTEGASLRTQAHEATHFLQQRAGQVHGHGVEGDPHEQAAEHIAALVEQGQSVEGELDRLLGEGGAHGAGGGERAAQAIQCLSITAGNLGGKAGIPAQHALLGAPAYQALLVALGAYEQASSVATAEAALLAARTCRTYVKATFPVVPQAQGAQAQAAFRPQRVTTQLDNLVNELHQDLDERLTAIAEDATLTVPQTVNLQTPRQRIDTAVSGLQDPGQRAQRKLILEYQQRLGFVGAELAEVKADGGPAILQNWRARGDMYHVGAVLNLYPQLKVIVYDLAEPPQVTDEASLAIAAERAAEWKQACMISQYYGQADRVQFTLANAKQGSKGDAYAFHDAMVNQRGLDAQKGLFLDVGGCTTVIGLHMQHARAQGTYGQAKQDLAAAVAPAPDPQDQTRATRQEIQTFLAQSGWQQQAKYVIVNFRASGHTQIEKQLASTPAQQHAQAIQQYDPAKDQEGGNHPDLDTGVRGVQQLAALATQRGFTPVFMGEEPAGQQHPHLIKYWDFQHQYAQQGQGQQAPQAVMQKLCRGGRAAEAFFLRVVAETYDVKLLSMRSGVTDQLAFLGIPTISIDLDNFHQASAPELLNVPAYQRPSDEVAHSWARGSKLETGLERDYGRVFLEEGRDLKDFHQGKWQGEFSQHDEGLIGSAFDQYFGTAQQPATADLGIRHASHPLHPDKLRATAGQGQQQDQEVRVALPGKIDSCLNPELVLAHARSVLGAQPPNVVEAKKFLDGHLEFTKVDRDHVPAKDAEHLGGRLQAYLTFLGQAEALLGPHGQGQAYQQQATLLRQELQQNQQNLQRVSAYVERLDGLRGKFRHALYTRFDPKAKKVAQQRTELALLEGVAVKQAQAAARPFAGAESAQLFVQRLRAVVQLAAPWALGLVNLQISGAQLSDPFYRLPFVEAAEAANALDAPVL